MPLLNDSLSVLPPALTINGAEVSALENFDIVNPATGAVFAKAPSASPDQVNAAMQAAAKAQLEWADDETARRRALHSVADVLVANVDVLSRTLTAEMGRPLAGSRSEIEMSAQWARYYAELDTTPEVIQDDSTAKAVVRHRPLGVVAAITPWNFPISLAMWKLAPALLAGNAVVLKPSPYTPLTTLQVGQLLQKVLPAGVLSVLTGPDPLGALLTAHEIPSKVAFTGSVATGKKVAAAAAADLKRVTLELGGNDAAIILDDVDLVDAVPRIFWDSFYNTGQICCAIKRVYAPASRYGEIVEALAEFARSVHVGDGFDEGVELGPLNNAPQLTKVQNFVGDALRRGAAIASGGNRLDLPGYFYEPTILSNARDGMPVVDEEQFGPVLPIVSYDRVEEALAAANASRLGLNGSVWTADLDRGAEIAARLSVGTALVNAGSAPEPHLPFGGVGWSGLGRENGRWGYESFTEAQTLYVKRGGRQA
ncbi:aldehyde dehydrogenase family protein [Paenarthrobacter sp. NPDC091711]|uniref:aldehyde dehydrogenase family protein n=1 Tax=Paenarthrobacter sp. NPDC091711 TaxID=3364385 RepID=UPI0038176C2F